MSKEISDKVEEEFVGMNGTALSSAVVQYVQLLKSKDQKVEVHINRSVHTYEAVVSNYGRIIHCYEKPKHGTRTEILVVVGVDVKDSLDYILMFYERYPYERLTLPIGKFMDKDVGEKMKLVNDLCKNVWGAKQK